MLLSGPMVVASSQKGLRAQLAPRPARPGGDELVVDVSVHQDAFSSSAALACAQEAADEGAFDGASKIGVLQDDHGTVVAHFEIWIFPAAR